MFRSLFLLILLSAATTSVARADGEACGNAKAPCSHPQKTFAPYELSFQLPKVIKPNTDYKSKPFYAVVLWTRPVGQEDECDAGEYSQKLEAERLKVQALLGTRKVFADQQCPDMGAVSYRIDGKASTRRLLAVFGGKNETEAKGVLTKVRQRYPKAAMRRMQVVWQRIEQ